MSNFENHKLSSTSLSTNNGKITSLIMAATVGAILNPLNVIAAPIAATITNYDGSPLSGTTVTSNDTSTGIVASAGANGVKIVLDDNLNTSANSIDLSLAAASSALVDLNGNNINSSTGVGIYSVSQHPNFEITGAGDVSGHTYGIRVFATETIIGGTGTTSSSDNDSSTILVYGNNGQDVTVTRSGAITNTASSGGSGLLAGNFSTGNVIIGKSGSSIGEITITGTGSGSNSNALYGFTQGGGDVSIYTTNSITNNSTGNARGVVAASDGTLDITVSDITLNSASTGNAIHIDNTSTGDVNITLNGTITAGDAANGSLALKKNDNQYSLYTVTNNGTINGGIDLWNIGSGTFTNNGSWKPISDFNAISLNVISGGTIDMQNNSASGLITGNSYQFGANSVLKVDVDHTGSADLIKIYSSNPSILGGALHVNALGSAALYSASSNIEYTLISTTGAGLVLSGTFDSLHDNLAFLDLEVNYDSGVNHYVIYKFIDASSGIDFKPHATGNNQDAAAIAMDGFDYSTTDSQELETSFKGLTNTQAKDAIKQIAGGDHLSARQSGAAIAHGFETAMMRGSTGGGSTTEPQAAGYTISATGAEVDVNLWARALGGYSQLKNPSGSALTTQSFGVIGGAEFTTSDDLTLGASVGYTRANFSTQSAGSSSHADNFHTGVSGAWGATSAFDTGFGLSGGLDATLHKYKTVRKIKIGGISRTASSTSSGVTIGGALNARYGYAVGDMVISPFVGLDISQTNNKAFAETGAGGLNISTNANSSKHLGTLIGAQLAGKFGDNVQASISAVWRHEFGNTNTTTVNKLAGSATSFTSTTPTEARNKIIVNGSLSIPTSDNASLTFSAFGEASTTSLNMGASASFILKF